MSTKKSSIDNRFSERLRGFIENELKITHGEFARKIGITSGYLSMVLTGKRGPSAEMIAGLHINYGERLKWLLIGESNERTGKKQVGRRFEIFNQAEDWLNEEVKKNPKREIWFEVEFEKAFQEFKAWKEEKEESEAKEAFSTSRKVA